MYLKPCQRCHLKKLCRRRTEKTKQMTAAGFTAARFKCEDLRKDLPGGTRVDVTLRTTDLGLVEFPGTVMRWRGEKVLLFLDRQDSDVNKFLLTATGLVSVFPDRLKKRDEPAAAICRECFLPESARLPKEFSWDCSCQNGKGGE